MPVWASTTLAHADITAEEVPILDGSAASFVFLLQTAGIELQNAPRRFIRLTRPVEVRQGQGAGEKWARLAPFHGVSAQFWRSILLIRRSTPPASA